MRCAIVLCLFAARSDTGESYPRFDLLRIGSLRAVLTSRAFMMALIILYTISSLWILPQPIVLGR